MELKGIFLFLDFIVIFYFWYLILSLLYVIGMFYMFVFFFIWFCWFFMSFKFLFNIWSEFKYFGYYVIYLFYFFFIKKDFKRLRLYYLNLMVFLKLMFKVFIYMNIGKYILFVRCCYKYLMNGICLRYGVKFKVIWYNKCVLFFDEGM